MTDPILDTKLEQLRAELATQTEAFDLAATITGGQNRRPAWWAAETRADMIALTCLRLVEFYPGTPRERDPDFSDVGGTVSAGQREQSLRDHLSSAREQHRGAVEAHNFVGAEESANDLAALCGELGKVVADDGTAGQVQSDDQRDSEERARVFSETGEIPGFNSGVDAGPTKDEMDAYFANIERKRVARKGKS